MPTFGKKRVTFVQKSDVKRFYNGLVDQKVLSISTVDNIHNVLHQVFQVAVDAAKENKRIGKLMQYAEIFQIDKEMQHLLMELSRKGRAKIWKTV